MSRLLIIEDEESLIPHIEEALSGLGEISVAKTIESAFALVGREEKHFDLVICDNSLPDGKGLDFVEFFKAESPQSLIFFLSGSVDLEDKLKGLGMEIEDFLEKPIEMRELRQRVRRALKRHNPNEF